MDRSRGISGISTRFFPCHADASCDCGLRRRSRQGTVSAGTGVPRSRKYGSGCRRDHAVRDQWPAHGLMCVECGQDCVRRTAALQATRARATMPGTDPSAEPPSLVAARRVLRGECIDAGRRRRRPPLRCRPVRPSVRVDCLSEGLDGCREARPPLLTRPLSRECVDLTPDETLQSLQCPG